MNRFEILVLIFTVGGLGGEASIFFLDDTSPNLIPPKNLETIDFADPISPSPQKRLLLTFLKMCSKRDFLLSHVDLENVIWKYKTGNHRISSN